MFIVRPSMSSRRGSAGRDAIALNHSISFRPAEPRREGYARQRYRHVTPTGVNLLQKFHLVNCLSPDKLGRSVVTSTSATYSTTVNTDGTGVTQRLQIATLPHFHNPFNFNSSLPASRNAPDPYS